jgi:uncharacterized protein YbjT (DUF2867 family)
MKVIIIGATGLVGGELTKLLIAHPLVTEVEVFSRRDLGMTHPKLKVHIVDFERMDLWRNKLRGDVLFSALGTTLKKAGSKEKQYLVDHDYQLKVSESAAMNGVKTYVLISSVNADPKSPFFYLRMKGELENKIATLPFYSINILRPGPLKGEREGVRLNEVLTNKLLDLVPQSLLTPGLRPIEALKVSQVALKAALQSERGIHVIGPGDIHRCSSEFL